VDGEITASFSPFAFSLGQGPADKRRDVIGRGLVVPPSFLPTFSHRIAQVTPSNAQLLPGSTYSFAAFRSEQFTHSFDPFTGCLTFGFF